MSWLRVVVQFITVLKGKRVHVNHSRLLAGELNRLLQIRNFVTLASSHKDVDFVRRAASNVIVEIDVRDIKRNVLFRMPREGFLQLVLGHLRQDDVLDDHRMTVDAGSYLGRLDFVFVENISNGSRDRIQFHYLTIND